MSAVRHRSQAPVTIDPTGRRAGILMVWIGGTFEQQLSGRIELVFFVPMIVYMSDIIGTETLALVVRSLAIDQMHVRRIFMKELLVGLSLGATGGIRWA